MGRTAAALDRALDDRYTLSLELDLSVPHRFAIFSDQHKGAGDGADEFMRCGPAYRAALERYLADGFSLILLGDVEELWEQGFREVERAHASSLELEASFGHGRYYRLWGNHDDAWMDPHEVERHLRPYVPNMAVHEGIRFAVTEAGVALGTLFLVHGHQGGFWSDKMRAPASYSLKAWREVQRITGWGKQTPSRDACLRGDHDREMYDWARRKDRVILIAGHTHRPVWSSRTHLQTLASDLAAERRAVSDPEGFTESRRRRIVALQREIAYLTTISRPCNDSTKPVPCYFNTGCCKFSDGDITGMELDDGELRLVKWTSTSGSRLVLEAGRLPALFAELPSATARSTPGLP